MSSIDANPYEIGLDKNAANYVPLTPISFLLRSAAEWEPIALNYTSGDRQPERCRLSPPWGLPERARQ
jgi:hypothetical protein